MQLSRLVMPASYVAGFFPQMCRMASACPSLQEGLSMKQGTASWALLRDGITCLTTGSLLLP